MSFMGDIIGDVIGGITGAKQAGNAGLAASQTQAASAQSGINAQQQQFDAIVKMMEPYLNAGQGALQGYGQYQDVGQQGLQGLQGYGTGGMEAYNQMGNLLGLGGNNAQGQAISDLQNSPLYTSHLQAGENSILQNASATGGLRGGNTQAALAQFSPQLLASTIQNQLANLGGLNAQGYNANSMLAGIGQNATQNLAGLGQSSAGLQANAGQSSANNIANLLNQQGAATAGGQLAQGNVASKTFGNLMGMGGLAAAFI